MYYPPDILGGKVALGTFDNVVWMAKGNAVYLDYYVLSNDGGLSTVVQLYGRNEIFNLPAPFSSIPRRYLVTQWTLSAGSAPFYELLGPVTDFGFAWAEFQVTASIPDPPPVPPPPKPVVAVGVQTVRL